MLAVPAVGAETGAVGAHAVLGAAWVAVLHVAAWATPPSLAHAPAGLAHTVHTAVQAAHLCNTAGRNRLVSHHIRYFFVNFFRAGACWPIYCNVAQ